jgi:phage portal protein BeeE
MSTLRIDPHAHQAASLMSWLAARGGLERAGLAPKNLTATSSDNEAMRALFQPLAASSGFAVTDYSSMLVSTIFACLSKIAGAWLQLPVHQYRMLADGGRELMGQTPIWWLLNESPHPRWTAAGWREWIVRCVHLRGDQHTEIVRKPGASAGGAVDYLKPHHPDNCRARCVGDRLRYDVFDPETQKTYGVDQDDMLHFSGFGFDGVKSLSVVQYAARNSIGNALAARDFSGRQLGEGAMPKIALTYPASSTTTRRSSARQLRRRLQRARQPEAAARAHRRRQGRSTARLQTDRHGAAREPALRARRHVPGVRRAAGADR